MFKNKCVLITGSAGTIGSALTHFILQNQPATIILLDNAETPLFNLEETLRLKGLKIDHIKFVLGSITNIALIEKLFSTHAIDFIFHTAAYKHVPIIERNPIPGVEVNCIGTKILSDASIKHKVKNFIFISTDKAVEPANVMGATKLLAEKYINALSEKHPESTRFITLRFGNVINSNGSVIPLFKEQLLNNGTLTITDREATRYFISLSKVIILLFESLKFAKTGDVFLFEMGESKSILEIAKETINELNFKEEKVQIETIGLRPGEKLHEDLVASDVNKEKTQHPEIYLVKEKKILSLKEITVDINILQKLANEQDTIAVVTQLKRILKTFKSRNSEFEDLD
ncbi:polysaccharide biosynthesis protein [Lacinutrix jangbogonensis]|uniref:polysaccharide biosynthesis protein n=1 Tax=Lacinutrix jangbogonensis TaxID=1469557 RepID=UPI00068DEC50|nr:polysaccharide biosynthesis protein [Lacinutrix jangbogonensis]